jgi:hypothetical protein
MKSRREFRANGQLCALYAFSVEFIIVLHENLSVLMLNEFSRLPGGPKKRSIFDPYSIVIRVKY